MVQHNNIVPNAHFHKDWARYVRTWFDQPAKKLARRTKRAEKAARCVARTCGLASRAVRPACLTPRTARRPAR
jgi:large subunit ribosomal protein L13e